MTWSLVTLKSFQILVAFRPKPVRFGWCGLAMGLEEVLVKLRHTNIHTYYNDSEKSEVNYE